MNGKDISEKQEDHLVNDILDIYNGVYNNYDEYQQTKTENNYNIDIINGMKLKFPDMYGEIPNVHELVLPKRIFDRVYSLGCEDKRIRSKN